MNGNNNPYPHEQIDNEITKDTLLSLVTGGKWQTSADIPPLSTDAQRTLLEVIAPIPKIGAISKAASLIPAIASEKYGYILKPLIKTLGLEREGRKIMKRQAREMSKAANIKRDMAIMRPKSHPVSPVEYDRMSRAQSARADNIQDEIKKLQVYEEALKQYRKFGAVRPGTEDYIREIGPSRENIGSLLEFLKK